MAIGPYSNEALSRVLSAHAGKQLEKFGGDWPESPDEDVVACVNQAAFLDPEAQSAYADYGDEAMEVAATFDGQYHPGMTAREVINLIDTAVAKVKTEKKQRHRQHVVAPTARWLARPRRATGRLVLLPRC